MVKNTPAVQEIWVRSLGWEDPRRRTWQPTPVSLPGKSHGQKSLVGCSPWGRKELGTTERLTLTYVQLCLTLCDPMYCSTPAFPVLHHLRELVQTHVHWVGDAIQPSHPLSSPSPPAFNHSQHQGLFQWVSSLHQVAKVLEFQLQHQSFQWIFRTDFI